MPLYRITIKADKNTNAVVLQKGMSVDIPTLTSTNPLLVNGGKEVQDAFMRIYGKDLRRAGALNSGYLDVKIIG